MQNQPSWVTFLYLSHKSSRKSGWSHGNTTQSFPLPSLPKPPSRHALSNLWTSRLSTVSIFPTKPRETSGKHESNNVLKWSKPSHGFPSFTENDLHFLLWPPKTRPHLPAYLAEFAPTTFSLWEPFAHTFLLFRMISQTFMWLIPSDSVLRSSILFSKIPYLTTPSKADKISQFLSLPLCICVFNLLTVSSTYGTWARAIVSICWVFFFSFFLSFFFFFAYFYFQTLLVFMFFVCVLIFLLLLCSAWQSEL